MCVSQNSRLPRGAMLRFRYKSYVTSPGEDERANLLRRPRTTPALLPRPLSSPLYVMALTFTISSHNRWSASWRGGGEMLQIVYKFLPQQNQNLLAWISLPRLTLWSYPVPPDFSDVRNFPHYLFVCSFVCSWLGFRFENTENVRFHTKAELSLFQSTQHGSVFHPPSFSVCIEVRSPWLKWP